MLTIDPRFGQGVFFLAKSIFHTDGHTDVPEVDNLVWSKVRNNKLDNTFTIKKIKNAFHRMGSFKGAGPDGLKPIVMKNFGPNCT